jgi:hypothetical protein
LGERLNFEKWCPAKFHRKIQRFGFDMIKFSFCIAQGKDDSNGTPRVAMIICFHMDDMDGYCHLEDHLE